VIFSSFNIPPSAYVKRTIDKDIYPRVVLFFYPGSQAADIPEHGKIAHLVADESVRRFSLDFFTNARRFFLIPPDKDQPVIFLSQLQCRGFADSGGRAGEQADLRAHAISGTVVTNTGGRCRYCVAARFLSIS
jgi:hypothetical protein